MLEYTVTLILTQYLGFLALFSCKTRKVADSMIK